MISPPVGRQHAAVVYFWVLILLWLLSPTLAYNFSELIEMHAVDTYGEFVDANSALLASLPPPRIALSYYCSDDMYMYDEFQTSRPPHSRRPPMRNLRDVFEAICGDEGEHVATMSACQDPKVLVQSPNTEMAVAAGVAASAALSAALAKVAEGAGGAVGQALEGDMAGGAEVDGGAVASLLSDAAEVLLKVLPFT